MQLNNVVIFVSNPFGFGPTGKTVALIEELRKSWKGKIVYAASPMCQETIPQYIKENIIIENIDERDEKSLLTIFNKYPNPLVVCTLNRLAVKTAKSLGLKAFFVDSLAWLWKEIPAEYLMADTYYCFNIFDIKMKLPARDNIKVIAPVFGLLPKYRTQKDPFTLFHIGGFKNPFQDKMSFAYLYLLAEGFSSFEPSMEVVVTGGFDAVSYMKSKVINNKFTFCTLGRDEFLNRLNDASHFITTSGLTATLEAFALRTPTSFIPPTNQSQSGILKLLSSMGCANSKIEWGDLLDYTVSFENMTEQEAIPIFHKVANDCYESPKSKQIFIEKLKQMMVSVPNNSNQIKFIESAGTDGSTVIVDDILANLEVIR